MHIKASVRILIVLFILFPFLSIFNGTYAEEAEDDEMGEEAGNEVEDEGEVERKNTEDSIVVWRLDAQAGVSDKQAASISGLLATEIEDISGRSIISEEDIRTIMRGEEVRQKCSNKDTSCIAEVGIALGAKEAISGDIGRVGKLWIMNLRRINVLEAKVIKRVSRKIRGSLENLVGALPGAAGELFGRKKKAAAKFIPADEEEENKELDFWYWGVSLGFVTAIPIGDDTAFPLTEKSGATTLMLPGEDEFKTSYGIYLDFPFDISPYFQLVPQLRVAFPGLNKGLYEKSSGLSDLGSSLFQIGIGGRLFLYLPDTMEHFRPYVAAYIHYVSMEVTKKEETDRSSTYSFSPSSQNDEEKEIFSAGYNGKSATFGLGARYDIWVPNVLGDKKNPDLVSFYLEVDWSQNFWDEFKIDIYEDTVFKADPKLSLNHIWIQLIVGYMF